MDDFERLGSLLWCFGNFASPGAIINHLYFVLDDKRPRNAVNLNKNIPPEHLLPPLRPITLLRAMCDISCKNVITALTRPESAYEAAIFANIMEHYCVKSAVEMWASYYPKRFLSMLNKVDDHYVVQRQYAFMPQCKHGFSEFYISSRALDNYSESL